MCGSSYSIYSDDEIYFLYLNRKPRKRSDLLFKPNDNMSPAHTAPTVRLDDGSRQFDPLTWGLIPKGFPEFKMKFSTIDAHSEGVFESRLSPWCSPGLAGRPG